MERNDPELPERLPDALLEGLLALDGAVPIVPPSVDHAMRDRIAQHFSERRRRRVIFRRLAPACAAAALLAIVLLRPWASNSAETHESRPRAIVAGDVDGSGFIDVLDPFALARALRDGRSIDPHHDQNGDGMIDRQDVDSLTRKVVTLEGDGR